MEVHVEIVRSNRKRSVGFSVRWPDTMVITAPRDLPKKTLDKMITERRNWAIKRLEQLAADYRRLGLPKYFAGGETFSYLGDDYPLTVLVSGSSTRSKCSLIDGRFVVEIPLAEEDDQPKYISKAIHNWYRQRAEEEIRDSIKRWSPVVGKTPSSASIRNQKSRWGSCSRRGAVSFNWRLVLLPRELLDYVVIHELCHMIEHNHSNRFWNLVEATFPDSRNSRKKLKRYAVYLDAI